jgi:hypothetical protein
MGENTTFLTLSLPKGDYCDNGEFMELEYILECDQNTDGLIILNQGDFDDESCSNTIKLRTKYGNKLYLSKK